MPNRLTHISTVSANGTTAPVSHGYRLNALGQRTRVDLADGGYWLYSYNAKGEPSRGGSGAVDWPKASPTGDRAAGSSRSQHRLVGATSGSTTLSFAYDAQSRRIANTSFAGKIRFLYDDWTTGAGDGSGEITAGGDPLSDMSGREGVNWKLVAEIDNTNSPIRRHLWGLDLSGSPQGAGGVGGLIATSLASGGAHFMAFDGNGNISAAINATDGSHSARFEYDPFGGTTSATGAAVPLLPFRFSTKYQDTLTGLYYYGYRYYNPETGRWVSRDQIEERGGLNLYGFAGNSPTGNIDSLGLFWKAIVIALVEGAGLVIDRAVLDDAWNDTIIDSYGGPDPFMDATERELMSKGGTLPMDMFKKARAKHSSPVNQSEGNLHGRLQNELLKSKLYEDKKAFILKRLQQGTAYQGFINVDFQDAGENALGYSIGGGQLHYHYKSGPPPVLELRLKDSYDFTGKGHPWGRLQDKGYLVVYDVDVFIEKIPCPKAAPEK